MVPLEFEQRQFLNACVAKARAFERQQFAAAAEQLRSEFAAEAAQLRAEMQEQVKTLHRALAAVHRKLADAIEESRLLREWRDAHIEHQQAKAELLALYRRLMLEEAWLVEFDPLTMQLQ